MYLLDLKPGGNSMLRNNNMSSTFRNSTFRKINYVDTWTFVIFKCILYCAAAWGVQGPKRANDIFTMTSPIANMWNFVQYFSYMCKFYFEYKLSTVAFLVKLPEDLPKLAFWSHVGNARPNWPNWVIPPLLEKYKTNANFEETARRSV